MSAVNGGEAPVPAPAQPLPVILRFRTVHLEPSIVLLGGIRRPEKHVLVLALSKGAAVKLAQTCLEIAEFLSAHDPRALYPLSLPGALMESLEAHAILKARADALKAAGPVTS